MSKKPLTSLEDFHPFEVSLVKAGANKKKRFPVWKQEQEMTTENFDEILKGILETELDEETPMLEKLEKVSKAALSEKATNALKSALRILSAFKDELPSDALDALAAAAGYPAPKMGAKEKKDQGTPAPADKDQAAVKKDLEGLPELVQKRLDSIEAENKALKEQNQTITKALTDQKDAAELAAWEAKAEKDLAHYPGKSFAEIAKSLHALAKVDQKLAEEQFTSMKAASDALKESAILKSAGGKGAPAENSAMGKIEKMAKELIEKSADINMTKEKAIAKVLERRPDLYDEYLKEAEQG